MARIGIDFDGCCVVALPEPGICNVDTGAAEVLGDLLKKGHELILWTCRNNDTGNPYNWINGEIRAESSLSEAVRWFRERDLELSGINYVPEEEKLIGKSRKILIDILIDDTALGSKLTIGEVEYTSLETGEIKRIKTYSIDWNWVREELTEMGLL